MGFTEEFNAMAREFRDTHKGYHVAYYAYQNGTVYLSISYDIDPYFFKDISETTIQFNMDAVKKWVTSKAHLCTQEFLLSEYEKRLEHVKTMRIRDDYDENYRGTSIIWLNERIAKLKGE